MFKVGRVSMLWLGVGVVWGGLLGKVLFQVDWYTYFDRIAFQLLTLACVWFIHFWQESKEHDKIQQAKQKIEQIGSCWQTYYLNDDRITRNGKEGH